MEKLINNADYENESYFENWSITATGEQLTRNGTDGRVYGGDCNLIHIPDGRRADVGRMLANILNDTMRAICENRTEAQRMAQLLCPGCYMVAVFNMATELAKRNNQPLKELANSMSKAFAELAANGPDAIEHITVELDPNQ